uniref:Uncharacterized protein n=1 Tax=Mustela putorius furo TaxID=9669 RepID=M3Y3K8_MUSPF
MLPSVPTALSFFPEGPGGCSKFAPAGERSRAPSEEGGGGGRRGEGAGAGGGGPGGGGAGVRGLLATFLQTTLPHAESTEISGALEGIASGREGGRQPGDHTGEPPPAASSGPPRAPRVSVPRTAGSARWLPRIPHFQPPNPGSPSPLPPLPPPPPASRSCCTFPSPQAPPPPRCTPGPLTARPLSGGKRNETGRVKKGDSRSRGEGRSSQHF